MRDCASCLGGGDLGGQASEGKRPRARLAHRALEAQDAEACGCSPCQQDGAHRLEADDNRRELRSCAARRPSRGPGGGCRIEIRPTGGLPHRPTRSCKSRGDGVIDRTEMRANPWDPSAQQGRVVDWNSRRGNHLGQRSNQPHQQAAHMDASDPIKPHKALVPWGPSTYGSRPSPGRH
jgi:hypothetical protein